MYLFNQITETAASKLGMEEFDVLSSLGRSCRDSDFQAQISEFFLRIINNSDDYSPVVIENCIDKFADMIKFHSLDRKLPYFNQLVSQLQNTESSALPVIRLYKKIIKDQKGRGTYGSYSGTSGTTSYGGTTVTHSQASTGGKTLYSKSYGTGGQNNNESIYGTGNPVYNEDDEDDDFREENKREQVETRDKNLTLRGILNELVTEKGFVEALLGNLEAYCRAVAQKVAADPSLLEETDRTKLNVFSANNSHADEVNERLLFLQEFAVNSDLQISKAQLQVIYDLLSQSAVKSDFPEFLRWCSNAVKAVTALDLDEVGAFFSELIESDRLDLSALPLVGFEFLCQFFVTQNYYEDKLEKVKPATKKVTTSSYSGGYYGSSNWNDDKDEDEVVAQEDDPTMKINVEPSQLTKIDIVWKLALEVQDEAVVGKAVAFLVNCYLSVNSPLEDRRNEILQSLNSRCFELLAERREEPALVKRVMSILECVIKISEKKGTGGVQPHNAILKGEMLDRIIVRYMIKNPTSYWGGKKLDRSIVIKLYTSATVWEFKKEVARILGLSPKYTKLKLPNKELIRDNQHGMTLQELKFKNGDVLVAEKIAVPTEKIVEAPLIDRVRRTLTPRAEAIFTEWYHLYNN